MLTKEREEEFLKEWKAALRAVPHENCASELGYACDCKLKAPLEKLNHIVTGFLYMIRPRVA